jgi:hypothetical protein
MKCWRRWTHGLVLVAVPGWVPAEWTVRYQLSHAYRDAASRRHWTAARRMVLDRGPKDFPDLLLTPGVGARTVRALAMVAEVMHGAPCRFTDPARFSLAHGGKDRHPFPVPLKVYDETIKMLKSAVQKAKLGRDEELGALRGSRHQQILPIESAKRQRRSPRPRVPERTIQAAVWR